MYPRLERCPAHLLADTTDAICPCPDGMCDCREVCPLRVWDEAHNSQFDGDLPGLGQDRLDDVTYLLQGVLMALRVLVGSFQGEAPAHVPLDVRAPRLLGCRQAWAAVAWRFMAEARHRRG